MRLVLDTDVVVAAVRSSTGASRWLLRAVLENRLAAVISVPLILEYEAVLSRPEHLAAAGLRLQEMFMVVDAIGAVGVHTPLSFRWRPLLHDPNDDMVIETAINGGAELLVTFNLQDFGSVSGQFGCRAVLPSQAVEIVRQKLK